MAKKKVTISRGRSVKNNALTAISPARIESMIMLPRGERVILDSDLAELYGVTTGRLNEQVRRNAARFPEDFVFYLNAEIGRAHV